MHPYECSKLRPEFAFKLHIGALIKKPLAIRGMHSCCAGCGVCGAGGGDARSGRGRGDCDGCTRRYLWFTTINLDEELKERVTDRKNTDKIVENLN